MYQFARWVVRRLTCSALGHAPAPGRFYYPPAKSVESGYICARCGHTQLLLYRWQTPVEPETESDDEGDDGDGTGQECAYCGLGDDAYPEPDDLGYGEWYTRGDGKLAHRGCSPRA